jgi:signal transduction histidine kinase
MFTKINSTSKINSILRSARTRILLWYFLISVFIFIVGIPLFRQVLFARVDQRVQNDMAKKAQTFRSLVAGESLVEQREAGDSPEVLADRKDDRFKVPENSKELAEFFDAFLSRQLPEDEVYLIAFIDGELYKSSPRARPEPLKKDSPLMKRWATSQVQTRGTEATKDPKLGDLLYLVELVQVKNPTSGQQETTGVLVIAHTTEGERTEVLEAVIAVIHVLGGVLVMALVLSWFASGQVLAPLRSLISTARSISESDLTQRIQVQGQGEMAELALTFNDMMDRLQGAFVSQRNFINDAGHELRTPVTIIRGHLELMGDDPTEREETLTLVMDELDRIARMVDDLTLLAKSERSDFLQWERVDLAKFTEELFAKAQALAERDWQLATIAQGTIQLDRYRITQAVMNLAQNAVQHTHPSDRIIIGSRVEKGMLNLWVQDFGEGISPDDQTKIFERFARAAKARRRSEGSGLGLAIVKAIVEAHDGQILLQSQQYFGSTFTIVLPDKVRSLN